MLCRKAGKLPGNTVTKSYDTEYSSDQLSIQIGAGCVVIVDGVLATGGTLATVYNLCFSGGYDLKDHLVLIDLRYCEEVNKTNKVEITINILIKFDR